MEIDNSIHLFQDTEILSIVSRAGYSTLIMGPQILSAWRDVGSKEFIVYINAGRDVLENIFDANDKFIVDEDNEGIVVEEIAGSNGYKMHFITMDDGDNILGPFEFFNYIAANNPLSAYQVGYQFPAGILYNGDCWKDLKEGIYDTSKSFSSAFNNDPALIEKIVNDLAQFPLISLSKNAIKAIIQNNKSVDSLSIEKKKAIIQTILTKNPSLFETLHNLNVLRWISPEIDARFAKKSRDLSDSFKNDGEALISAVAGLPIDISFSITSLVASGVNFIPSNADETILYTKCIEKSILFAEKYIPEDAHTIPVNMLINLLADPIPTEDEEIKEYILANFSSTMDLAVLITAFSAFSSMFNDEINNKVINKLGVLAKYAQKTRKCWDRDSIDIDDEELISLVGEDNFDEALRYIRELLFDNPMLNNFDAISDLIIGSNLFGITDEEDNAIFEQNQKEQELRKEQNDLINEIVAFDDSRIKRIRSPIGPLNKADEDYLKRYEELNQRLDSVNQIIVETGFASDEEQEFLKSCHETRSNEEKPKKHEPLEFTENDTEFFERIRTMSMALS